MPHPIPHLPSQKLIFLILKVGLLLGVGVTAVTAQISVSGRTQPRVAPAEATASLERLTRQVKIPQIPQIMGIKISALKKQKLPVLTAQELVTDAKQKNRRSVLTGN